MLKALLLCFLLLQVEESSPFKDNGLTAGSRACNGTLRIYPGYLNWETGFSSCDHVTYRKIQSSENGPWIYRLNKKRGCLYSVIEVHKPGEDGIFWDVIGYTTVTAWRKQNQNATESLSCAMY